MGKKRIAITGGLGFIGNEVVRQAMVEHEVFILDNSERVAKESDDISGISLFHVDITQAEQVEAALLKIRPEIVIHLAALHFIPECNTFPERTLEVNLSGTNALMRVSQQIGVKHFVFLSSGAVYADSSQSLSEDSRTAPVDIYGWSKYFGEDLCRWYASQKKMKVTVTRLFNTYGPRETNAHIIPEILEQLKTSDVLHLGNITPRRDYIFVEDTAKGLLLLGTRPAPEPLTVVNLCSGCHASVRELVDLIGELTNRKLSVTRDEVRFRATDKEIQVGDNARLRAVIGWTPKTDLRHGLSSLLKFEGLIDFEL